MNIGLYDPYLDTLGGGEKYFLTVLEEAVGLEGAVVTLFSPSKPSVKDWKRLNISIPARKFRWQKATDETVGAYTHDLDLFIVLHAAIPPESHAKRSVAIVQFPFEYLPFKRKRHFARPLASLKDRGRFKKNLSSYDLFVCYTNFVKTHLRQRLEVQKIKVINPPVDVVSAKGTAKKHRILAVGRFFQGGHNKKHDVMIKAFHELSGQLKDPWELHLAGGAGNDAGTKAYLADLRKMAGGLPIHFHANVSYEKLMSLYDQSALFWHAAGFGENAKKYPERLEHFGITTVEAMMRGCVPVVIALGGQTEIVEDGRNGYLWHNIEELVAKTKRLAQDPKLRRRLATRARKDALDFGKERFLKSVRKDILE